MTALAEARQGKRTLRTHAVEFKAPPDVTPRDVVRVRRLLTYERSYAGEPGAGPREAQCAGSAVNQFGEALSGYG